MVRDVLERPSGRGGGTLCVEADASVTEMAEAIPAGVAEYSQPLDAPYAGALTRAVRHAVDTFIDRVADPDTALTAIVTEFRGLGSADASTSAAPPPGVLIDWSRREPCVLIPDPDGPGRLARIERAPLGWDAVLGPVVPLARAATSLRWARLALGLAIPTAASSLRSRCGRGICSAGQGPDTFPLPRPPTGPASNNVDSIPWRRGHLNPVLEQPILTLDRICWCVPIRPARMDRGLDDKRPPAGEGHSYPARPAGRGRTGPAR